MKRETGKVYLIGAGPGAADLITLRGLRAMREAEVLLCDALLPQSFVDDLGISREGKEIRWLGDETGRAISQRDTNRMMSDAALSGRCVARVKNGDSFVFGRGAEEIEHLAERSIPFEVIPGLSSCLAAPAMAGLPLTRRGEERSFAVTTARLTGGLVTKSYPHGDSLVVLMGASVVEEVTGSLLEKGWAGSTPAAIVERAGHPFERRLEGSLSDIAAMAAAAGVRSAAVLIVGGAARRRGALRRPRLLYTGVDPRGLGWMGDLIRWPAIRPVQNTFAQALLPELVRRAVKGGFGWLVFTGPMSVRDFFEALERQGMDARSLGGTKVMALGHLAACGLEEAGVRADVVFEGHQRGEELCVCEEGGRGVLVIDDGYVTTALEAGRLDGRVSVLPLYRMAPHPWRRRPLPEHDVLLVDHPEAVQALFEAHGASVVEGDVVALDEATRLELERRRGGREGAGVVQADDAERSLYGMRG